MHHYAAIGNSVWIGELYISKGINIKKKEMKELLISKGIDIKTKEIRELLRSLSKGVDINAKDIII